jgi:hypothetical protein
MDVIDEDDTDDQFEFTTHDRLRNYAHSLQCQLIDLNSSEMKHDEEIILANSIQEEVDTIKLRAITISDWDANEDKNDFVFTPSQNPSLI